MCVCVGGVQNEPPQGTRWWYANYFELKATETMKAKKKVLYPSP